MLQHPTQISTCWSYGWLYVERLFNLVQLVCHHHHFFLDVSLRVNNRCSVQVKVVLHLILGGEAEAGEKVAK